MSERSKTAFGRVSFVGLIFSLIGGLWISASALLSGGEILHEIKGLREDVNEIKATVKSDREETRNAFREIINDQRKLERRVEVLEMQDPRRLNGYKDHQ